MLKDFVSKYSLEDIRHLEESRDRQYIALLNCWNSMQKLWIKDDKYVFLKLVLQNSLISYQLSWTWESWWQEFSACVVDNEQFHKTNNLDVWKYFLKNCKKNCRLTDVKFQRLMRLQKIFDNIRNSDDFWFYYQNMYILNKMLAKIMDQKHNAKTIVFAVKMFWYASRISFQEFLFYPFEVQIPLDSRLKKIYEINVGVWSNPREVLDYFENLSNETNIPPLHLDSVLWIDYWNSI